MPADQEDQADELAVTMAALAPTVNDLEADRVRANVRRKLAGVVPKPVKVGRFEVLDTLGSGAMGTVYRALDPELHRQVAVKVLRDSNLDHQGPLREARALARLSHPNTVTVYEVGEDRGSLYLAMELVDGQNLREWLNQPRPWQSIVRVMVDAGRGLIAAHQADLVHGDFKPDNVLVGDDRVRVADFGLAKLRASDAGQRPDAHLSEATTFAGTPAYMAPEQLDGKAASPATDQFAFATTLYEALTGQRPYAGDTIEELKAAIRNREGAAAGLDGLPSWLRRILLRGLDPAPGSRYPTMQALVAALDRRPERSLLRKVIAAAVVGSMAVAAAAYFQGRDHDPCAGATEDLVRSWSPQRAQAVEQALMATSVPRAGQTWKQIEASVESYSTSWASAHRQVCEATHVRGEQSDTLLDARMRCLARRLDRFAALTTLMERIHSGAEATRAATALRELAPVTTCLDPDGVLPEDTLPDDVTLRSQVEELQGLLDQGWSFYALGRYDDASNIADRMAPQVDSLGYPLTRAEVLLFLGTLGGRVGTPSSATPRLKEALNDAATAKADHLIAEIWTRLLKEALFSGDHQRVIEWSTFARAATIRAGAPPSTIDAIVGEAEILAGRSQAAIDILEPAIVMMKRDEINPRSIAIALGNLGNAYLLLGNIEKAESIYQAALLQAETDLGAGHPGLARYYDKLGRISLAKGQPRQALAHHARALEVRTAAYGDDDRAVASTLIDTSRAEMAVGELDRAEKKLDRAHQIRRRAYGDDHVRLAEILQAQGDVALLAGDVAKAAQQWQRSLSIRRRDTPNHPMITALECRLTLVPADEGSTRHRLQACDESAQPNGQTVSDD